MNGKCLLDTNTIISFMRNDKKIVDAINESEEVFIPVTVVGELYYGAFKSKKTTRGGHLGLVKIEQ